ncbi:MAG TPA: hypothetical protein VJ749_08065 [Pyrinomonadaceae bacterium]|nr:hypothetical protein [Pyrinomonadaceae bacterium]
MESEPLDFGRGFWRECRRLTGKRIDVLRDQNIPHNSRCIDRTLVPNGVVSHKSTDLRRKSYRSAATVYRRGMNFVADLVAYEGEVRCDHKKKATYHLHWALEGAEPPRVLEWFVPALGVSEEQAAALKRVVQDSATLGVRVEIYRVAE